MSGEIVVTTVDMTCGACPSQWEGKTDDDRPVYARYRYGCLTVDMGEPGQSVEDAILNGQEVFSWDAGGGLDGVMDLEQLRTLTAGVIQWPDSDGGSRWWDSDSAARQPGPAGEGEREPS